MLYQKIDVLLLADCFESFRDFFIKNHQLDPTHCYSTPGLTWQCGLKYTGIELDLITDYDMFLMIEKGIRGGFSGVLGNRYVKCNNKYLQSRNPKGDLEDYDKTKETNYLLYLDANNLYGYAMSQDLPTHNFQWEPDMISKNPEESLKAIYESDKEYGFLLECDLELDNNTKFKTHKLPIAPIKREVKYEELSEYQKSKVSEKDYIKSEKLILDLHNKEKYVIHYKLLKRYIELGAKVTKIHRIISFEQSPWLKKYIDFNTNQRTKAKTEFEKDIWKLMNNSFYGKTVENIRNRYNVQLINDEKVALKLQTINTYNGQKIISDDITLIKSKQPTIYFNKPIYLGMSVLDLSKDLMYDFFYNTILKTWDFNNIDLCYHDTDSFILNIKTEDVYKDLEKIKEDLDTSEYPKEHPLFNLKNKKVIGKFKDELNGKIISEAVFIRAKNYAYQGTKTEKKLKGVPKSNIKKIKFEAFKNCVLNNINSKEIFKKLQPLNFKMYVENQEKKALENFDDKRYLINNIKTIPYGMESLYFI